MQKVLTPEEQFVATDFTEKTQIQLLFPEYIQQALASKKNLSKAVNIESFTLKTPYGDKVLLKDVDLIIESGKRQCLYGANSTGKTLLFHNMSHGKIKDFPRHIHVHHCQELEGEELNHKVIDTVVQAHPYRRILVKIIEKLESLVATETDATKLEKLKENLNYVNFQFKTIGGPTTVDRAQKMLRVLGFDEIGQAKPVSALSGGLRMRVALCMAFMIDADLLLLDEPTNHLDFPSVLWLENRLLGYKGSFLMVSHDRELLNNVCTAVAVIEDQTIKYYACGFKEFEKKKGAEDKKKYDDIEKFLIANRNVDPSTFLGKQRADKKLWADTYHSRQVAIAGKFTFPDPTPLTNLVPDDSGNIPKPEDISIFNMKNLRFSYDATTGNWIFNDPIAFNVTASTRCGVMGPNGAGKSTFLKLLTNKLTPNDGTVTPHPDFHLAYFGQHSTAELDLEATASEFMGLSFPDEQAGVLRSHLAKTSIVGTTQDTKMGALSYSQRSCIVFSKLTFKCPHLLIMDEPTNFLDLESVDSLISACNKYPGALLLVSHNRDFLRKCAKNYLSITPASFVLYDNLKDAERGTYTFIAEMEEGGSGVGKDALKNNPGGGTVHSSQKVGGATLGGAKPAATIGGAKPAGAAAAKPAAAAAVTYAVGEKIQALWTDGKWYGGSVKKIEADGKYSVLYTQYGNTAKLTPASMKKADAPKAAPAAAAAGAKPAAAAAPKK
jgi:ATPase subunit of ABC transporter with duplicated ATPase domains